MTFIYEDVAYTQTENELLSQLEAFDSYRTTDRQRETHTILPPKLLSHPFAGVVMQIRHNAKLNVVQSQAKSLLGISPLFV